MEQKKPETVEEMTKRIRDEEKAKISADAPRDVVPTFDVSGSKPKKGGGAGGWQLYASIAIIALIICFIVNAVLGVSASKFNSTAASFNNQISTINTSVKALQTSVATVTSNQATDEANLKTATTSDASQLASLTSQITALQGSLSNLTGYATTGQFTSLSNSLTSLQNTVNTLSASVQNAPASSALTALQTSVTNLLAEIKVDEAELAVQHTMILALQTTTTTTSSTTGTGLTAVIVPNAFGGGQTVSFNSLPNTTSSPNTELGIFNFSLINNTGATANNIQLAVVLETLAGNGTTNNLVDLTNGSYAATVNVSLNGYITSWTQVVTGQNGVLGFQNTIPTGILANLGTISETSGNTINPFTMTVTVTIAPTTTTIPVPSFTIVPMVKVVSFTK
jgi:TolA-binding protein